MQHLLIHHLLSVLHYKLETTDRVGTDPEKLRRFLLRELSNEAATLDVLPEGSGLKISFLWFQCLKRYGQAWQKSNATLRAMSRRELKRDGNRAAGKSKKAWII